MHLVYANRKLLYRTTARSLVAAAGAAPCCCGGSANCYCQRNPLIGCGGSFVPDSCCTWGTSWRQGLSLTFSIGYDKPPTINNPFSLQATLTGRVDAVRRVVCVDNAETVTYTVSDFALFGQAVTSTGRVSEVSITRGNWDEVVPAEYGTFGGFVEAMFLGLGQTCYTGGPELRLKYAAAFVRSILWLRLYPLGDGEFAAVPDPFSSGGLFYDTNTDACNAGLVGSRCDCPRSFRYVRSSGLPYTGSFGVYGVTYEPTYNWTSTSCDCRRTVYSASNQYSLQDSGVPNFAGTVTINGAYAHVVSDVVECVPNPCGISPPPPPGMGACCLGDGSCTITTAADCFTQSGSYFPGLPCELSPCGGGGGVLGACRTTTGGCFDLTRDECLARGDANSWTQGESCRGCAGCGQDGGL